LKAPLERLAMSDLELGKREIEREHLGLFIDAYQLATGETFSEMYDSETPDFVGRDEAGRIVGIEIAQLRFSPDERHMRRIEPPDPHDMDAWWRLLELMHQKDQKLTKGYWPHCDRKILVIMLGDAGIGALTAATETDKPRQHGFDEVWLADHTQVEAFGAVDLFAVVHPMLEGRFATGDWGQKPFG
jgi:hypothetical protein